VRCSERLLADDRARTVDFHNARLGVVRALAEGTVRGQDEDVAVGQLADIAGEEAIGLAVLPDDLACAVDLHHAVLVRWLIASQGEKYGAGKAAVILTHDESVRTHGFSRRGHRG